MKKYLTLLFCFLAAAVFGQSLYNGTFHGGLIGGAQNSTNLLVNGTPLPGSAFVQTNGVAATIKQRIFYVATNGNDSTAVIGSPTFPYSWTDLTNQTTLLSQVTNGDVIFMLNGIYNYGNGVILLPRTVTLCGQSEKGTILNCSGTGFMKPQDNDTFINFSSIGSLFMGSGYQESFTNVAFLGLNLGGVLDIFWTASTGPGLPQPQQVYTIENCTLNSDFDFIASTASGTLTSINNTFYENGSNPGRIILGQGNVIDIASSLYGENILSPNVNSQAQIFGGKTVNLSGTSIYSTNSNVSQCIVTLGTPLIGSFSVNGVPITVNSGPSGNFQNIGNGGVFCGFLNATNPIYNYSPASFSVASDTGGSGYWLNQSFVFSNNITVGGYTMPLWTNTVAANQNVLVAFGGFYQIVSNIDIANITSESVEYYQFICNAGYGFGAVGTNLNVLNSGSTVGHWIDYAGNFNDILVVTNPATIQYSTGNFYNTTEAGTNSAGAFSGNGSGLTGLQSTNVVFSGYPLTLANLVTNNPSECTNAVLIGNEGSFYLGAIFTANSQTSYLPVLTVNFPFVTSTNVIRIDGSFAANLPVNGFTWTNNVANGDLAKWYTTSTSNSITFYEGGTTFAASSSAAGWFHTTQTATPNYP